MSENSTAEAALAYLRAGFSVVPIRADGSKRPSLPSWDHLKEARPAEAEVSSWYAAGEILGVGVVCGSASGNLLVLDFEFSDFYREWAALVESEAPGLLATLPQVLTPGKKDDRGRHVYLRCPEPVSGKKLARVTNREALARAGDSGKTTAIETRGQGHQVLAPGTPAECHETGRLYEPLPGPAIADTPTLAAEQVALLLELCRALDRSDKARTIEGPAHVYAEDGVARPGDEFNRLADWQQILEPFGWGLVMRRGAVAYWRRPGKDSGVSATTGHCSTERSGDMLYVFSTNAEPFESDRAYSRFAAFAILRCGGDYKAAARELGRAGYGAPAESRQEGIPLQAVGDAVSGRPTAEPVEPCPPPTPPRVADFPLECLPRALAKYAHEIAESMCCPPDFPAVAMLATAGTAIGASRGVSVQRTWLELPRLYAAIVADPGSAKSPATDQIVQPLMDRQNVWHQNYLVEKEEYRKQMREWESQKKTRSKGSDDCSEDDPAGKEPEKPIYRHCYTTDPTAEGLIPMLAENPRGMLFYRDELTGWIASMNQYKAGGKGADRQVWLSVWSGGTAKVDRKGNRENGSLIANKPFINVLGGIQPDMLSTLEDERGRQDGFIHRILFSYPTPRPWSTRIGNSIPEGSECAWQAALEVMFSWQMQPGKKDGMPVPVAMQLDGLAREAADDWWADHTRERNATEFPPTLIGPWSKMRSYYFRLMVTLHCLREACGEIDFRPVDEESAVGAWALIDYFKSHARFVYSRVHCTRDDVKIERIVQWIRRHNGCVTPRALHRARLVERASEAMKTLNDLQDLGWGRIRHRQGGNGRSVTEFLLANPDEDICNVEDSCS